MTATLHGFDAATSARLAALRERVHRVYPDPANRYVDYQTACWLAFWRWSDGHDHGLATGHIDRRAEWTCDNPDVTFSTEGGLPQVRLRDCMSAYGMNRDHALSELDGMVERYVARLEQMGAAANAPHTLHQLRIMRDYLTARRAARDSCPCYPEGGVPCGCETDRRIAH